MDGASWGALAVRTLLSLLAVVALAVLVLRHLGRRFGRRGRALSLVDRLPLDGGRTLYLVEAPGRFLVLGGGGTGGLEVLAELDPEAVAEALAQAPEGEEAVPWWAGLKP